MRHVAPRHSAGFTIIELMMVVFVAAVFVAVALPSFSTAINNSRLQSASNELASLIQYARSSAVQNNQSMNICVSSGVWASAKAAPTPVQLFCAHSRRPLA